MQGWDREGDIQLRLPLNKPLITCFFCIEQVFPSKSPVGQAAVLLNTLPNSDEYVIVFPPSSKRCGSFGYPFYPSHPHLSPWDAVQEPRPF